MHTNRRLPAAAVLACLLVMSSSCAVTSKPTGAAVVPDTRQQVLARFNQLAEAAKHLDHEAYFELFEPQQFTALMADGTTLQSFDQFREIYLAGVSAVTRYEWLRFDPVQITVLSDSTALLINEFEAQLVLHSGRRVTAAGAGSQLWHRTETGWRLISIASSNRPTPASAQP